MREEFLEPMPMPHSDAKLLMGKSQAVCYVVEVTADGFRVAVPGVEQYEGDPKLTLVTRSANYPVRLVLQEPHVGGYSYRLQRIENVAMSARKPRMSQRLVLVMSTCCAAGLVSVITASHYSIPRPNELAALLTRRTLRYESTGSWSPSIAENDRVPPGISVDHSLSANDAVVNETDDFSSTSQNVAFSMVSTASITTSDRSISTLDRPVNKVASSGNFEQSGGSSVRTSRRDVSLKGLIEQGQTGRVQPASRELLTWLNRSAPSAEHVMFRLSDAAWLDLQRFEIGLKQLPENESTLAVESLRRALFCATSDLRSPCNISGSPHVFVVACNDAKIYFRKIHGQIELVRVLPIDFSKEEHS